MSAPLYGFRSDPSVLSGQQSGDASGQGVDSPLTQAELNALPNPANDLDAGHLHIFDAQAQTAKLNSNVDYWFSDKWRAFTADQAWQKVTADYAEQQKQKAENQQLWQAGQGGAGPSLESSGSQGVYGAMVDLMNSAPQRPGQAPLPPVNPWGAAVGALGAIIDPRHAFDYAAAPLAYGLQSQSDQTKLDQLRWQDRMQQIAATQGIMEHQAAQLADNERLAYTQKLASFNRDLDRVYGARMAGFQAGQQWGQVVFQANSELQRMDVGAKLQLAQQMVSTLNDPGQAPGIQARNAAFLQAIGIPIERLAQLTPQQQQAVLGNAMLDMQVKKLAALTPIEVETAREQYHQLKIQGKYMDEEAQAKLALIWAQANNAQLAPGFQSQQLGIDSRRLDLEYGALGSARQAGAAAQKIGEDLFKVRADIGQMHDDAVAALKKEGKWINPRAGFFQPGWNLDEKQAAERNEEQVQAALNASGEYKALSARETELRSQLDAAQDWAGKMNKVAGRGGENPVASGDLGERYRQAGAKYVWGGTSDKGLDCSAFTQRIYKDAGLTIPRTAQEQFDYVQKLPKASAAVGDLVFFGSGPNSIKHVGLIVGFNDRGVPLMRHMSSARDGVVDVDLDKYLQSVKKIGYQVQGVGRPGERS